MLAYYVLAGGLVTFGCVMLVELWRDRDSALMRVVSGLVKMCGMAGGLATLYGLALVLGFDFDKWQSFAFSDDRGGMPWWRGAVLTGPFFFAGLLMIPMLGFASDAGGGLRRRRHPQGASE